MPALARPLRATPNQRQPSGGAADPRAIERGCRHRRGYPERRTGRIRTGRSGRAAHGAPPVHPGAPSRRRRFTIKARPSNGRAAGEIVSARCVDQCVVTGDDADGTSCSLGAGAYCSPQPRRSPSEQDDKGVSWRRRGVQRKSSVRCKGGTPRALAEYEHKEASE